MENLDLKCAQLGEKIGMNLDEKILTDALGILEEQGVYALFLYLKTKNQNISKYCFDFLKQTPADSPLILTDNKENMMLQDLAKDLDKLLFARDLLLQAFVYARYHAKIKSEKE